MLSFRQSLYNAVLPFRANKNIMFGICRTCALIDNTGECRHTANEKRAIPGKGFMHKFRLFADKVYRIVEIYEMYEYLVKRYELVTREGGLFANYLDLFPKLKAESSGYPE